MGACLALPLLEAMIPESLVASANAKPSQFKSLAKSVVQQPRMICCYIPNGVNILEWMPQGKGADYKLSPTLETLSDFRDDLTVLTGLGHPVSPGGHSGADTWLTGADLTSTPGSEYTNQISIDQVVAAKHGKLTRLPSLQLSDRSGTGSSGHSHTLSFDRSGTPMPAEDSPQRLFERLFVPDQAADRDATLRRYAEKRSILDDVMSEARMLSKQLGKTDRKKLDEYFSSVRETEKRVERLEGWIDVPKREVKSDLLQLNMQPSNAHDRPMWIDVMMEISYLAFLTDTTRVITFEWSREAGGYGGAGENHHELSHHGGDAEMLTKLAKIDRFHLQRLAKFLHLLKSTDDGGGTMLDHTMVLYGSGMNSGKGGEHSPKNLPTLLAGGNKLGLKHGSHLGFDPDDHPPLNNLLLTLAQKMEIETDKFHDASGTLSNLA